MELEESICLGEFCLLGDVSQEGVELVAGAIRFVPVNGRGREDQLLEQVDAMFPRYSQEHNALSGFIYDINKAFSLGQ